MQDGVHRGDTKELIELFLWQVTRKVNNVGLVSVEGLDFEVDGMLKQRQVEVRSNPFDLSWIHIYYQGRFFAGQGARGFVRLRNRIPARFLENSSVYIDDPTLGLRGILLSIASQLNLNTKYFKWQLVPELKAAIEKNFADYHPAQRCGHFEHGL
ncbi:MAG: Mu transposase C-terminal domain-containing protein [Candidatus Nitrosotenuis sp.]